MFCLLFLCFAVLPIVELALLIKIGRAIDWPATVGLVLATGAIGAALARWQGLLVLRKIQEEMAQGQLPGRSLFDGALILLAGAVLMTPGVITDAMGFLLLLPFVRSLLAKGLRRYAQGRVQVHMSGGFPPGGFPPPGAGGFPSPGAFPGGGPFQRPQDDVIDVEARSRPAPPPPGLPNEGPEQAE